MAEEKGSSFSLPSTGAIAIVLSLVGYLLIAPNAFLDERPITTQTADNDTGYPQDIDARLWQDPFDAIKSDLEKSSAKSAKVTLTQLTGSSVQIDFTGKFGSEDRNEHGLSKIKSSWPDNSQQKVTVIAAMVSGGPYSEMQEVRIRRRYALASALSTLHFKPDDPEHIGYFKPEFSDKPKNSEQNYGATRNSELQKHELPDAIPFEWFSPSEYGSTCKSQSDTPSCERILVLWVDDTRFNEKPIRKIREIFNLATPHDCEKSKTPCIDIKKVNYAVIGPNDSGQLKALTDETPDPSSETDNSVKSEKIRFYSAGATEEDDLILGESKQGGVIKTLAGKNIHLTRAIADDRQIANKLVSELKLRRIDPNTDHIVLLSDWDTSYGRALPITFSAASHGVGTGQWLKNNVNGCSDSLGNIHCFSYERGIDGKLPGKSADEKKGDTKNDSQSAPQKSSNIYDRPDGFSQKDYLRRVADQVRALDRKIIEEDKCFDLSRRCGVSAIGVLGYDIYDKLAILQALRTYFPGKLFFTTELDALYSSPKELPYTHNLIVASSYGLQLRPEIQKNVPPFRDSYQTSFFLATLLAIRGENDGLNANGINSKIEQWLHEARIFEIGRKKEIDLSGNNNYQACTGQFSLCNDIHPSGLFALPHNYESILRATFVLLSIFLLYRASWDVRKLVGGIGGELKACCRNPTPKRILFVLGIAMLVIALIWAIAHSDEPFLWADGVSIWPAELLRIFAFVLSILFLWSMKKKLIDANKILENKYALEKCPCGTEIEPASAEDSSKKPKCTRTFSEFINSVYDWKIESREKEKVNVKQLWSEYCQKGTFHARIVRSLPNLLFFILFAVAAIRLSGGLPAPTRGEVAFNADKLISAIAGIAVLWLTMVVVDASRLAYKLIQHLEGKNTNTDEGTPSDWPNSDRFSKDWGLRKDYLVYWIDIRFVADLTETIGSFIYYPIIVLLIMTAARSSIFDDSVFSYGLAISISVLLLYLISCAYLLQSGAKEMRQKAINKLTKELRILQGTNARTATASRVETEISRLKVMIDEIENIKKGAFTPFMQQPPVKAVLALLSGGSSLPLLERFF